MPGYKYQSEAAIELKFDWPGLTQKYHKFCLAKKTKT
jgi:hypothetical protein